MRLAECRAEEERRLASDSVEAVERSTSDEGVCRPREGDIVACVVLLLLLGAWRSWLFDGATLRLRLN